MKKRQEFEPFVKSLSQPMPRPTAREIDVAFRWMNSEIRLRSAKAAIGYEGTSTNAMRALFGIFMRGVRLGKIKIRLTK